jgi:integrase
MLKLHAFDTTTTTPADEAPARAAPAPRQRKLYRLETKTGRDALKPRPDPYFQKVRKHFALGLRKTMHGAVWCARWDHKGKREAITLGALTPTFGHVEALQKAEVWLADLRGGVRPRDAEGAIVNVEWACKLYAESLELERPGTSKDAKSRFTRDLWGGTTSHDTYERRAFADLELSKLTAYDFVQWRDSLVKDGASKTNANRTFCYVKAALRKAADLGKAPAAVKGICSLVQKFRTGDNRRTAYLDLAQRRRVIGALVGGLRDLVEAVALTAARPGELAKMRRSDFDATTGSAKFNGKTGVRRVPLTAQAITLMKRLARDKLPQAYLFVRDDGKPWKGSQWGIALTKVLNVLREAEANVEPDQRLPAGVVLYTFRHCWITDALTYGGMSPLEAARMTGTSIVQIEKHYGHLVQNAARARLASFAML